jgi:hypothetical protein
MGIRWAQGFAHWSPMMVAKGLMDWKCFEFGRGAALQKVVMTRYQPKYRKRPHAK